MANLFDPPHFIAIEGPIRVGKSTLAEILADTLRARRIVEPEHNPFLEEFYTGKKSSAFETQMWFLMERYEQMLRESTLGFEGTAVADYIFEKDKIFAYINLTDEELNLYNRYYNMFREKMPTPDLVIYLQASPEILKQRVRRKGVSGERAISDDYLEQVIAAYEHFFFHYTSSDLLVVNTSDIDFVNNNADLQMLLKRLSEPIKGTQYFLPLGTERQI
ncbi:MAG TPA: deoxynucleoside kinase [Acidisarcina sp.]|nr:deoxynucleoside kinase [Acidisarcina sp.]